MSNNPVETQPEETQPEEAQPEEAQPEETQPEEAQPEETQPEEAQPEEREPDPVVECLQDKQAMIDAQEQFVLHCLFVLDARHLPEFITEANYYIVIELYERKRRTDKSDKEAERLYAAMCKAYDVYHESHERAIQYRYKEMRKANSYTCWLAPL
jgi:hypothetical protein